MLQSANESTMFMVNTMTQPEVDFLLQVSKVSRFQRL
jgi:hypothetical protein